MILLTTIPFYLPRFVVQEVSRLFIRQILGVLHQAHLVNIQRGSGAGWSLARPPEKISLLEVYQATQHLKPGTQTFTFPFSHHGRKFLDELIRLGNRWISGTKLGKETHNGLIRTGVALLLQFAVNLLCIVVPSSSV